MILSKTMRQMAASALVAVAATALAYFCSHYLTVFSSLENIAADIRIASLQAPQKQSSDIVVIGITEETVAMFPYRSPVDRGFLAKLLLDLEQKKVRLIGVDILLDQATESVKDDALHKVLRSIQLPVLVSYTNTLGIVNEAQLSFLNAFVPEKLRGGANFSTDPYDGSVRWIYSGEDKAGDPMGFARKAAALLGVETPVSAAEIAWKPSQDSETPPFPMFPAHVVANLPAEWFAGKIVLIGAILSMTDRHRTPMAVVYDDDRGNMPGVMVHAHSIAQILEGRTTQKVGIGGFVLTTLIWGLIGVGVGLLKKGIVFNVVSGLVLVVLLWVGGMTGFTHGLPLVPLVAPTLSLALSLWMMDVILGSAERKQRKFVQGAFSRYVSPAVVKQLVDNPESLKISGVKRDLTFIFTDIAGFTTLSEKLSPEKLAEVLNAYLEGGCEIILRHAGTVDKFIGDAIMSIFNAPIEQADHVSRGVRCALELDAFAERFRIAQNALGVPLGHTRLGVHSGPAVIGNFGSKFRMDFTALGDTVNTAARTEGVNKYFGTRICCTEAVVVQCPDLHFRPIGEVVLKGKLTGVVLYNPVSDTEASEPLHSRYLEVYGLLRTDHPNAKEAVCQLHHDYPDDPLTRFHFDRVNSGIVSSRVVMEDK